MATTLQHIQEVSWGAYGIVVIGTAAACCRCSLMGVWWAPCRHSDRLRLCCGHKVYAHTAGAVHYVHLLATVALCYCRAMCWDLTPGAVCGFFWAVLGVAVLLVGLSVVSVMQGSCSPPEQYSWNALAGRVPKHPGQER